MADLTTNEKEILEELFKMRGGDVLNFSCRTISEFFDNELKINIYDELYEYESGSKANRLRKFWKISDNAIVGKSIIQLIEYIENQIFLKRFEQDNYPDSLLTVGKKIAERLLENNIKKFEDENKLEIFLSYSSIDKDIAGKIKNRIEWYGIKVFLAHEDIEVSEEWEKIILLHLDTCSVFIPIISKNFKLSNWTGQEMGIAIAKEKFIIPVSLGEIPLGFISKIQAQPVNARNIVVAIHKIISKIQVNIKLKNLLSEAVIESFLNSFTFDEAKQKAGFLNQFDFTPEQVNKIIEGSLANSQIYECFKAKDTLRVFIKKYDSVIEPSFKEELLQKINS